MAALRALLQQLALKVLLEPFPLAERISITDPFAVSHGIGGICVWEMGVGEGHDRGQGQRMGQTKGPLTHSGKLVSLYKQSWGLQVCPILPPWGGFSGWATSS